MTASSTGTAGATADFLIKRLDVAWDRLQALALRPHTDALTTADAKTGEQWQLGQAWAHVAEFPRYWTGELCIVLNSRPGTVPAFGRILTDEARLEAVRPENARTAAEVLPRLAGDIRTLRTLLSLVREEQWELRGEHAVHGVMTTVELIDEFLVGHLEEHCDQIAELYG
jgi:hypothetical protein